MPGRRYEEQPHEIGKYSGSLDEHFTAARDRGNKGDSQYWNSFWDRITPKMHAYALQRIGNHEKAEEIVQEAKIRAYKAANNFKGQSAVTTWLYRIIANIANDMQKKKGNNVRVEGLYKTISNHKDGDSEVERDDLPAHTFEDEVLRNAEIAEIEKAFPRLDQNYQEVLRRFHAQQQAYAEIAKDLGLPVGTVKSRLNRARLTLRQFVEEERKREK